jgi:Zn finger protein HypA/HybF involved in hydrogenase expression
MENTGKCPHCGSRLKEILSGKDIIVKQIAY